MVNTFIKTNIIRHIKILVKYLVANVYFPLSLYQKICDEIKKSNLSVYTVEQFIMEKPSNQFIILRHDVDLNPSRALNMAKIEHQYDIKATYYFRYMPFTFNINIIKSISKMGHEIGYHYETLKKCKGNMDQSINLFKSELEKIKQSGVDIKTVCSHGSKGHIINVDIFHYYPKLKDEVNLLGEAYLDVDFNNLTYVTDSMGVWTRCKHGVDPSLRDPQQRMKASEIDASEPRVITKLVKDILCSGVNRYYFLIHPQYYLKNYNIIVKIVNHLIQGHVLPHVLVFDQLE